jgi:hypothetical protein
MPRVYVRKKQLRYTADDLEKGLNLIRDGKLKVQEVATQFHIPIPTLYARLSGLRSGNKPGAKTILSNEEEKFLIHVIHKFQEWQQPLTQSELISIARTFMIELKKKNITENSCLREWFYSFKNRWKSEIKKAAVYKLESIRSNSCTQLTVGKNQLF